VRNAGIIINVWVSIPGTVVDADAAKGLGNPTIESKENVTVLLW